MTDKQDQKKQILDDIKNGTYVDRKDVQDAANKDRIDRAANGGR